MNETGDNSNAKADLDRVLGIIRQLPIIRRYGDDGVAIKEAIEILEALQEKL